MKKYLLFLVVILIAIGVVYALGTHKRTIRDIGSSGSEYEECYCDNYKSVNVAQDGCYRSGDEFSWCSRCRLCYIGITGTLTCGSYQYYGSDMCGN